MTLSGNTTSLSEDAMRIGYDAKRAYYNFSGLGNYSRNIIQLMCRYYPANDYYLYTPGIREGTGDFPPEGVTLRTPSTIFTKKFTSLWRTAGLSKELAGDRLDLYHGLSNELPLNIARTGIRSVVTIHDLIFIRFPGLYPRIDRGIYKQKLRYAVKTADRIIAISEQTRRDLMEYAGASAAKISVVYQSCNPAFREKAGR